MRRFPAIVAVCIFIAGITTSGAQETPLPQTLPLPPPPLNPEKQACQQCINKYFRDNRVEQHIAIERDNGLIYGGTLGALGVLISYFSPDPMSKLAALLTIATGMIGTAVQQADDASQHAMLDATANCANVCKPDTNVIPIPNVSDDQPTPEPVPAPITPTVTHRPPRVPLGPGAAGLPPGIGIVIDELGPIIPAPDYSEPFGPFGGPQRGPGTQPGSQDTAVPGGCVGGICAGRSPTAGPLPATRAPIARPPGITIPPAGSPSNAPTAVRSPATSVPSAGPLPAIGTTAARSRGVTIPSVGSSSTTAAPTAGVSKASRAPVHSAVASTKHTAPASGTRSGTTIQRTMASRSAASRPGLTSSRVTTSSSVSRQVPVTRNAPIMLRKRSQ